MFDKKVAPSLTILIAISVLFLVKINTKNTCISYFDYFLNNFGGGCYHNPDVDLSVSELIEKYTGVGQNYTLVTEDGYILTMFRILRKDPVGVVLLQPPISAGAVAWLSDGSASLGFTLWRKGYDIWLSNHRGVSYSRKHVNLTEEDSQFWDYSFHEIAVYDLDAQFELIRKETNNSKIIFIGYSMSSTIGLTYAALNPEKSRDFVESYILVAPVVIMKHFSALYYKILFYIMYPFECILRAGEFLTAEAFRYISQFINIIPTLTNIGTSMLNGWTGEMDPVLYPYIFAHHGRGITNKMIYHFGQIYFNGTDFLMYDYGKEGNRVLYGSEAPPTYPLQNVSSPVYIIYGDSDTLATPSDIKILCDILPKEQLHGIYEIENHNHIDYFFSRHRQTKTYETIYEILDRIIRCRKK